MVIRVGQLFDLADTEVAIRYSFAGDLDGRDVCIYPANLSASLGSQLCCESRSTANIQKLVPLPTLVSSKTTSQNGRPKRS